MSKKDSFWFQKVKNWLLTTNNAENEAGIVGLMPKLLNHSFKMCQFRSKIFLLRIFMG